MKTSSQAQRILDALIEAQGRFVPMAELSRRGSGKPNGWTASFSRRTFELRQAGYPIQMREEYVGGERNTFYAL